MSKNRWCEYFTHKKSLDAYTSLTEKNSEKYWCVLIQVDEQKLLTHKQIPKLRVLLHEVMQVWIQQWILLQNIKKVVSSCNNLLQDSTPYQLNEVVSTVASAAHRIRRVKTYIYNHRLAHILRPASAWHVPGLHFKPMFFLTFSNFWVILDRLCETLSRLYRRRSLQVNT